MVSFKEMSLSTENKGADLKQAAGETRGLPSAHLHCESRSKMLSAENFNSGLFVCFILIYFCVCVIMQAKEKGEEEANVGGETIQRNIRSVLSVASYSDGLLDGRYFIIFATC